MSGTYLRWFAINLGILVGVVAIWLLAVGLVGSGGNTDLIARELPFATFQFVGVMLVPTLVYLGVLMYVRQRTASRRLRTFAVLLSPLTLIAFVPTVVQNVEITDPIRYIGGGLILAFAYGLTLRMPPSPPAGLPTP